MGKCFAGLLIAVISTLARVSPVSAQMFGQGAMDRGKVFVFEGGEALFKGVCQGCHMSDAKGAMGAGSYPSLVRDQKLESAGYPLAVILHGQKAMPAFSGMMSDRQIADVVNYLRSNFNNKYRDKVSPADVSAAR
jgi:mono/diheme cytochrome c family protein